MHDDVDLREMIHVTAIAILVLAADEPAASEPDFKPSLQIESDDEGWRAPGLRVGLGYGIDDVIGVGGVPGGAHHSVVLRLGARLDEDWSLLGTIRYGVHPGTPRSLRYGATIEPTYHVAEGLTLAIGVGIGGFVIPNTGAPTPTPEVDAQWTACTEETGRVDPDTQEPINLHQLWTNYAVSVSWLFWWR